MIPQRARFDHPFAHDWILLSDYYFFILFSMVVMGFVMVFEWDALFPDRKDYLILTPLPLGGGSIFAGKTLALVSFLGTLRDRRELFLYAAGAAGDGRRRHAGARGVEVDWSSRDRGPGGGYICGPDASRACRAC